MAKSSDRNSQANGDHLSSRSPSPLTHDQWFQAGVSAFKAGNYAQALSIFQRLEQSAPRYRLKSQMGQVRVYQKIGQLDTARHLCQQLMSSQSPKVQQWASHTLQTMAAASARPAEHNPLEQLPQKQSQELGTQITAESANPPSQPPPALDQTASLNQQADNVDLSGFTPLEATASDQPDQEAALGAEPADPDANQQSTLSDPVTQSSSQSIPPSRPPKAEEAISQPSLFHYQQLNQPLPDQDAAVLPSIAATDKKHSTPQQPTVSRPSFHPNPARRRQSASRRPVGLWIVEVITAIATIGLSIWLVHGVLRSLNWLFQSIRWPFQLPTIGIFSQNYTGLIIGIAILVIVGSPWLLDQGLQWLYHQHNFSTRQLTIHSPTAVSLLRQVCRQRGWQLPELRVIPTEAPLCFSYGWLPRNTRVVISQGLLENLTEEAIATLYGYELAHIVNWDLPVISALSVLLLAFYGLYERLTQWGEQRSNPLHRSIIGGLAIIPYAGFWLFRTLGLWLSRRRSDWCDRIAPTLTGQPTQHQQILVQLTEQIATAVANQSHLHPLLISLDLLMPISHHQAISPGSFLNHIGLEELIAWDYQNPYRLWLMRHASHPLLGERLATLGISGQASQVTPSSLNFDHLDCCHTDPGEILSSDNQLTLRDLLLQQSPLIGLLAGGGIAMVLWFIGGIVQALEWSSISWFYQDSSILLGGLLLGFGLGMLLRINTLYPDIPTAKSRGSAQSQTTDLDPLLHGPIRLPVEGHPVILKGRLAGPSGLTNELCQQLYLSSDSGIVNLQVISLLGPLMNWRQRHRHPASWINHPVTVTGWARRGGGVLWVEVADIRRERFPIFRGNSPVWTTALSLVASLLGILIIFVGN